MGKCPRCTKEVYFAEEARAIGKTWHKSCLTCAVCRTRLDSTTCRDHDQEIYCASCHGKNFGPKGYGFAGGASGLSMDRGHASRVTNVPVGLSKAQVPPTNQVPPKIQDPRNLLQNLNTCPVCGNAVYMAEKITGPGSQAYHKLCFKCSDCNNQLDSTTVADHDHKIYCKACYNKNFGPKGFGYGQALQRTK